MQERSTLSDLRYSQAQILAGLHKVWPGITGGDKPFDASTNLYQYMKADGSLADLDFADIFYALETFFGFHCLIDDWKDFLGFDIMKTQGEPKWLETVASRLTFGALAEFIRARTTGIALEPLEVFGKSCLPAGIFRGIEQAARQIDPQIRPFAPSTPIRDRFRGRQLERFWTRLRWISENRLPPLPSFWRHSESYAALLGAFVSLGGIFFSIRNKTWSLFLGSLAIFVILRISARFYRTVVNPVPPGFDTFRDLAKRMSEIREDVILE